MTYTGYQLLWFFLIYSFVGWCGEVAVSVIKQHKFVNRGFVTGPLCPIYGMGAFAFAIFLPDLKNDWIFLFLGSMILAAGGIHDHEYGHFIGGGDSLYSKKLRTNSSEYRQ